MADPEKPHFSNTTLGVSERLQQVLGGRLMSVFSGSDSPNYRQLNWFSRRIETSIQSTINVPGNLLAGRLPRSWDIAVIMATRDEELDKLTSYGDDQQEAVAYISKGVVHVGTHPEGDNLFGFLDDNFEECAIAMRLGRGPLEATMGMWFPHDRHFMSVGSARVDTPEIHINRLPDEHPGMSLV